jgi:DNA-binding response OmpR family regulator
VIVSLLVNKTMSRILVVEDEAGLSGAIQEWLQDECYVVTVESDGQEALKKLKSGTYELALLDWMLPNLSGLEICQSFRAAGGSTPILMLTAKSTLSAKEEGLDSGADDYLTKPFSMRELSARVRALLRRPKTRPEMVIEAGGIRLDRKSLRVTKADLPIKLLPKEFILLEVLMRHCGVVLSTENLIDHVWGSHSEITPDTVRSHVKSLRKKIDAPKSSSIIKTVHGMGYMIEAD